MKENFMKIYPDKQELKDRIALNKKRLENDEYYKIEGIFAPDTYDWYGDKEGRALLAFVSHYKIDGTKIDCMEKMLSEMPKRTNKYLFFGPEVGDVIYEQQLSGHSWLLRGLCEHYEQFADEFSYKALTVITEHLFLPTKGKYSTYPVDRESLDAGGVSGSGIGSIGIWRLSSDVGCAFMSIDGLSHVYKITGDERVRELLDEMIDVYLGIDKLKLRVQTHCTLSAARGMMRMYNCTKAEKYLDGAKEIYELYTSCGGMTYTYQNLNWWGRPDTWTEPCAIVDSLMLALELYKATHEDNYRRTAARIYVNGLATAQRDNGGAGTDTLICKNSPWDSLFVQMYEAFFCCTMRLSEGLWYINENADDLYIETSGKIGQNENGVYTDGDLVYAEVSGDGANYVTNSVTVNGHKLSPILKYYNLPRNTALNTKQKIVFKKD